LASSIVLHEPSKREFIISALSLFPCNFQHSELHHISLPRAQQRLSNFCARGGTPIPVSMTSICKERLKEVLVMRAVSTKDVKFVTSTINTSIACILRPHLLHRDASYTNNDIKSSSTSFR